MILFRNEQYWQKGVPYLDKIVFRSIPDHQTRFASLLSGEIDMIALDRGTLIHKARKSPSLQTIASDGNGAEIVIINHRIPPLDDLRVRRALAMANSQRLHVDLVYGGTVPFVRHTVGPALKCAEDGYIEHDPAAARKSIAKYGKPIRIECIHTNTSRGRQTGELLQQLFKKIGVELTLAPLSTGPHVMKVLEGNYDLATWRILGSKDMSVQLYRSFHSKSRANYTGYRDPVLDELNRVLQEDAVFFFFVSNQRFLPILSIGRGLDKMGFRRLGDRYRSFFNRISRHYNCDDYPVWNNRLVRAGFIIEDWWDYFSPQALRVLEWGHYFGLASWISKKLTGNWIMVQTAWNLSLTRRMIEKHYDRAPEHDLGVYTFYVARKQSD